MSHTPGPWTVAQGAQSIYTAGGLLVAHVAIKSAVCGEPASNARLIAAAPEMLEFVRMALEYVTHGEGMAPSGVRLMDVSERARALLSKVGA